MIRWVGIILLFITNAVFAQRDSTNKYGPHLNIGLNKIFMINKSYDNWVLSQFNQVNNRNFSGLFIELGGTSNKIDVGIYTLLDNPNEIGAIYLGTNIVDRKNVLSYLNLDIGVRLQTNQNFIVKNS